MPFARSGPVRIAYEVEGEGAPLLLIIGIGSPLSMWPPAFVAGAARRGFRVIRADHRDAGRSDRLDHLGRPSRLDIALRLTAGRRFRPPYTLAEMAADQLAVLDELGIRSAHVLGTSMGGMVAQELALLAPERVRSLSLLMTTTGARRVSRGSGRVWRAMVRPLPADREAAARQVASLLRLLAGEKLPLDPDEALARARASLERGMHEDGFARHLAAILDSGDRTRRLAAIRAPTLVVHGDADRLLPLAAGRAVAEAIPGARLLVIPGMGHGLPAAVHDRILDAAAALAREADQVEGSSGP